MVIIFLDKQLHSVQQYFHKQQKRRVALARIRSVTISQHFFEIESIIQYLL